MLSQIQLSACFAGVIIASYSCIYFVYCTSRRIQTIICIFLLLFTTLTAYNILLYPKISPLRKIPTPKQKPLWQRLLKEPTPWLFEKWMKQVPNDGLIRYFGIFNQERLLVTTSDGVRDVLVTNPYHFHKQRAQKTHLEPVLGKGLVFVEGDTHKFHRKQMSPAFATKCIRDCQPIFWKKTKEIVDIFTDQIRSQSSHKHWVEEHLKDVIVKVDSDSSSDEKSEDGLAPVGIHKELSSVIEIHDPVSRAALDIIGLAGCSFKFNSLNKDEIQNKMVQDYRRAFGVSPSNRIRCLLAHVVPAWMTNYAPIQRNRDVAIATRLVRELARRIISEKRQCKPQERLRPDFLDKAMQSGEFSDPVLVEQVKTLLAAGHDTTSSALASAAAMLSQPKHQHIQDKLRAEIREKLPPFSRPTLASSMDIESMPYLTAVRNEILRLFPPFSWYFRRSVVNTSICGIPVPKDTDIILCPWGLHTLKSHWGPDAEDFNPERWLKDPSGKGGARDAYCFTTFAAGPRVCIAERFARNEISTLMAGIFGRFRVEPARGVAESPLSHQLTLTHVGGVKVKMTLLEDWQ